MTVESFHQPGFHSHRRLLDVAALALFCAVLTVMSWRLYQHRPLAGPATKDGWALRDYRDVIYYPVLAVRDGVNPYDTARDGDPHRFTSRYPVYLPLPLYSPLIFLAFAPLAILPFGVSCVGFAVLNAMLFVLLTWLTLRAIGWRPRMASVFGLTTLLLVSQPGRALFYTGQAALPLAVATIGALHWGDRRGWKSGALVAFLTCKPTYGGPLGLLLAARRDWRSAFAGLALGGVIFLAGMVMIFARSGDLSVDRAIQVIGRNQSDFSVDHSVVLVASKTRIDLAGAAEYLTNHPLPDWVGPAVAALVLGLTGSVLWRAYRPTDVQSAVSTISALMILAMYICIYHNVYDVPLLIVPIAACATAAHATWKELSLALRTVVIILLIIPFVNILWTDGFHDLLARAGINWGESGGATIGWAFRLSCAVNGLALTSAWGILLVCVANRNRRSVVQSSLDSHAASTSTSERTYEAMAIP